jgi:hypothetical protein
MTTPLTQDRAEIVATLFALQQAFEELIVRGLESTGTDDTRRLATLGDELARAGAAYLAGLISALVHAIKERDDGAARALLRAQTAARVFERVLSLDAAAEAFGGGDPAGFAGGAGGKAPRGEAGPPERAGSAAAPPATTGTSAPDTALVPVLEELASLIEGVIGSGLTTATKATLEKLGASFQEASRLRLLRLATSLRYVTDECGRFLAESEHFSARRLAFFLNRTWLLARGLREAIDESNHAAISRLLLQSTPQPVTAVTAAVIGVQKRALLDGSAAFEFRMRTLGDAPGVPLGTRLVWSCVFGARKNVPAEAFLHLPRPQKFTPRTLLDGRRITIAGAAITADGRVMLGPKSTVTAGAPFDRWSKLVTWDTGRALERIRTHAISPLDLEVELQEEIVVTDYELGAAAPNPFRAEQQVMPLCASGLELDAVVPDGPDGAELLAALADVRKGKKKPALYGLVHYEMARLVFQPLTAITHKGTQHLMISSEKIDLAALMKTLDFTT